MDTILCPNPRHGAGLDRRQRINWVDVSSWNTDQILEPAVQAEISRIMAFFWADAKVEVTPRANEKVIALFRFKKVN